MSFSNYNENYLLAYLMSSKTVYVGYGTASAGEDGSGATEPSGGTAYARQAYGAYTVTAVGVDDQEVTNDNVITFPTATASQGTVTHIYFYDAVTAGNFLGEVSLADLLLADFNAGIGSIMSIPATKCVITMD